MHGSEGRRGELCAGTPDGASLLQCAEKCPGLGAVGSDSSLFNGSCDGILCSGALCSALVPLTHSSHLSVFVTLPLWEAQAAVSEQ